MTPVRLEPAALRSRVKHSTTEPLRSLGLVRNAFRITSYKFNSGLILSITFVKKCCQSSCDHSLTCTHVQFCNTSPLPGTECTYEQNIEMWTKLKVDQFNTSANAFYTAFDYVLKSTQQIYIFILKICVHIHSQIHFLYVALAKFYTYVYTIFVLYYVIHALVLFYVIHATSKSF